MLSWVVVQNNCVHDCSLTAWPRCLSVITGALGLAP
jgi:hypothetical protein